MELMIDIGNTHTVIGLFLNGKLEHTWRMNSDHFRTEDECWIVLRSFFGLTAHDPADITGVSVSSVVPDITWVYRRMLGKYLQQDPLVIGPHLDLGMRILYHDPLAVGADRICNAVAARKKYGAPVIVLDFGTATTFDCVDSNGDYLGGIICPGIESAASVLHHKAAKLPKIDLEFPDVIIGRNTQESMQSGIMFGSVVMVDGLVSKIRRELGSEARVVATGGLAHAISAHTESIDSVEDHLNIEGIYLIYKNNSGAR